MLGGKLVQAGKDRVTRSVHVYRIAIETKLRASRGQSLHFVDQGFVIRTRQLEHEIMRPQWIEGFLDLVVRLRAHPQLATSVLRELDLRLARRLGSPRDASRAQVTWASDAVTVDQLADTIEKFLLNVWFGPASAYVNGSARTPPLVQPIREEKLESTSNCAFR